MTNGDINEILAGLHRFIESVVLPIEVEHQEILENPRELYNDAGVMVPAARELRREVRVRSSEAGYYTMFASSALGGGGLGMRDLFTVWESLHHRYGPGRILPYDAVGHWTSGPGLMLEGLSEKLAHDVVEDIMSGRSITCFGMSEPDAGSDAWAMRTTATLAGQEWRINGTKQWITNGPTADYIVVFAVTGDESRKMKTGGITAFLIAMDTPGVRLDSVVKLFGEIGGKESIISFDNVTACVDQIVGDFDQGMKLGLSGIGIGRIFNAARSVGLGCWALEQSVAYSKERIAFGSPISDYQGIQFPLADSAMELYGAATMAVDCANRLDQNISSTKELSMVKAFTTETCFRVFDRAIQIHGGMGLTNDLRLVDGFMQARIARIADGTAEIMRRSIWRELSRGRLEIGPLPPSVHSDRAL